MTRTQEKDQSDLESSIGCLDFHGAILQRQDTGSGGGVQYRAAWHGDSGTRWGAAAPPHRSVQIHQDNNTR